MSTSCQTIVNKSRKVSSSRHLVDQDWLLKTNHVFLWHINFFLDKKSAFQCPFRSFVCHNSSKTGPGGSKWAPGISRAHYDIPRKAQKLILGDSLMKINDCRGSEDAMSISKFSIDFPSRAYQDSFRHDLSAAYYWVIKFLEGKEGKRSIYTPCPTRGRQTYFWGRQFVSSEMTWGRV